MKTSMRFDLVDLRLFLFVVDAANITHGAAQAGMALASASERIRLMEESLGAPLLERQTVRQNLPYRRDAGYCAITRSGRNVTTTRSSSSRPGIESGSVT